MRGNAHVRFGGRAEETDRSRGRHRASVRPYTISWLSRCRGILIRWEKKAANYRGLLKLACALLWFRRHHRLSHT
jgi:hypothetical protein